MLVKLITSKKIRFGKRLNVNGIDVQVGSKGEVEVDESHVATLLTVDFQLVDQDQKFDSEEQVDATKKVQVIINEAKLEAERIISEAKTEAEKILSAAKKVTEVENKEEQEKTKFKESLIQLKVDEIKSKLAASGVPEAKYKDLKKSELVDLAVELAFS